MKFIICVLAVLTTSCSMFQKLSCNENRARDFGVKDAQAWDANRTHINEGNSCEGEYSPSTFRNHYLASYNSTLESQCTADKAKSYGAEAAAQLDYDRKSKGRLDICKGFAKSLQTLKTAYDQGYFEELCAKDKIVAQGTLQGGSFAAADYGRIDHCPGAQKKTLKLAYDTAYKNAVVEACGPVESSRRGTKDGRANIPIDQGIANISKCPKNLQQSSLQTYQTGYQLERTKMENEELRKRQDELARQQQEMLRQQQENNYRQAINRDRYDFNVDNNPAFSSCRVQDRNAFVKITNNSRFSINIRDALLIDFYDQFGKAIESKEVRISSTNIWANTSADFRENFIPHNAFACVARPK
jgi:hypothetical protein